MQALNRGRLPGDMVIQKVNKCGDEHHGKDRCVTAFSAAI